MRVVELRPPPTGLAGGRSVDAWIDLNRGVRALLKAGRFVLFTDDAVGDREEESLQHLTSNLGPERDLSQIIPFLTCKHPRDYCTLFARRAISHGVEAITVTGGDPGAGPPRCVPRSRDLRAIVREQEPSLALGAWVNPYRDAAEQVGLLMESGHEADYYLTQVVSHHDLGPLDRFRNEAERRGLSVPGLVGVFYYRSANRRTLARLGEFIPVPGEALVGEFEDGATAEVVCARTMRALEEMGVDKVYVSNLTPLSAQRRLEEIEALL